MQCTDCLGRLGRRSLAKNDEGEAKKSTDFVNAIWTFVAPPHAASWRVERSAKVAPLSRRNALLKAERC